ncbi:hypothetical protein PYW07_002968 [Mythimna separata]|uniref:Arrestin C-terminal-like domain-containing protein n=1 Tax=Mythimna separata TaxID=271217 RepID=A0AAD8DR25_MYTSE|nr:hypothetical protein PYW07_002968 [Mythimna separata]
MAVAFNNGVIRLDSTPEFVFYAGQVVSGSIQFELDHPLTFNVIFIQFLGEANVSWTETEIQKVGNVRNHRIVKYEGKETYFNHTINLVGGQGTSNLPIGFQNIPFKFQIPFTAPSSFKGDQGQVSYTMQAHLVTPENIHAHAVIAKDFTVVAPFDLNTGSDRIKEAIQLEFEELYGCDCFCFSSDPVTIRVRMPVSGYCPGQVIPVSVEVDNESRVEITKMIFEILSKELYRSQHPASEYIPPEKVMATIKKGSIMSKSQRKFTVELPVPEFIVPYLENCSIIDVGYFFRITIKLSGCNDELQDEAELCLGQVPVQVFTNGPYVHPMAHSLPTGPIPNPENTTEFLIPPPTVSIRGSNTSLQRVQYNQAQAYQGNQGPYSNNPPPYPYPSGNVSMEMKARPLQGSDIGFKLPEVVPIGGPGYPTSGPGYPTSGPGYPTSGPGYPTSGPGYPTSGPGYPTSGPVHPTAGPGYPTAGPGYPTSGPGYPTSGPGYPTSGPGFPTSAPSGMNPPSYSAATGSNNGAAPYGHGGYAPTAPPPSS